MPESTLNIFERLEKLFRDERCRELADLPAAFREWQIDSSQEREFPAFSILSPSFGTLRGTGQASIDKTLEQFIHGSLVSLERAIEDGKSLTWSTVSEEFMQSPYMELDSTRTKDVHQNFYREKRQWKLWDGRSKPGRNEDVLRQVKGWLHELISDIDIITSTKIQTQEIADVVDRAGPFRQGSASAKWVEKPFVEVGILRYPDYSSPHIRIYRIKLVAWASAKRKGFQVENLSGIQGHFLAYHYKPRKEFIQQKLKMAMDFALEDDARAPQYP